MKFPRHGLAAITGLALLTVTASGSGCQIQQLGFEFASDSGASDGRAGDVGVGATVDASKSVGDALCTSTQKPLGAACGCTDECASGFCVDGICCNSECAGACNACNVAGRMGSCSFVSDGLRPRKAGTCPESPASGCGLDGTCDGEGHCRQHVKGTPCLPGTCDGDAQVGVGLCDGRGTCKRDSTMNCAPFTCDSSGGKGKCLEGCTTDAHCAQGGKCVGGSCGTRPRGMACSSAGDCTSGICADGICCDVPCTGSCVSCNQVGREGTCTAVKEGQPDPKKACADQGAVSCATTGACDGKGACAKYAPGTICRAGACAASGGYWNAESTCDGAGNCAAGTAIACQPYTCGTTGCLERCQKDTDCVGGQFCVDGSCGLRANGQSCRAATECVSNFCVDGVCCNEGCLGACRSCTLAASRGTCQFVDGGASDPRGKCTDEGPTSCGTDGTCTAEGACHRYGSTTACGNESCKDGVYKPSSHCNGQGSCVAQASQTCVPYVCNGDRCFSSCSNNAACAVSYVCDKGSCGKKEIGAVCSKAAECGSGFCAQGICCESACDGICRSCSQAGAMGRCKMVPDGAGDPSGTCRDSLAKTCGTDGKCDGAGSCRRYAAGTTCKAASCLSSGESLKAASTCDGKGACVAGDNQSCAPFVCDAGACRVSCSSDQDCLAPNRCMKGICGRLPLGAACSSATECSSNHCVNGACCGEASCGVCKSCNVSGQAGRCANVPQYKLDPGNRCGVSLPCGNIGVCNGAGACLKVPKNTTCGDGGCKGSSKSEPPRCDGVGNCVGGAITSCAPYLCDTDGTCRVSCTSDKQCVEKAMCELDNKNKKKNTCYY